MPVRDRTAPRCRPQTNECGHPECGGGRRLLERTEAVHNLLSDTAWVLAESDTNEGWPHVVAEVAQHGDEEPMQRWVIAAELVEHVWHDHAEHAQEDACDKCTADISDAADNGDHEKQQALETIEVGIVRQGAALGGPQQASQTSHCR